MIYPGWESVPRKLNCVVTCSITRKWCCAVVLHNEAFLDQAFTLCRPSNHPLQYESQPQLTEGSTCSDFSTRATICTDLSPIFFHCCKTHQVLRCYHLLGALCGQDPLSSRQSHTSRRVKMCSIFSSSTS